MANQRIETDQWLNSLANLRQASTSRLTTLGALFFLGYIPLLISVPRWFPVDSTIASAAAAEGYNNSVAYYVTVLWTIIGVGAIAVLTHIKSIQPAASNQNLQPELDPGLVRRRIHLKEIALVLAGVLFLYFPVFLAKYGPYVEDLEFLNALHRMQIGHQPYVDFEFPYGPLMLYPAFLWTKLFGYSMVNYYGYLALLEALVYVVLVIMVQIYVPQTYRRWIIIAIIGCFLFNDLLGLNYNSVRRFLPVVILMLLTSRPLDRRIIALAAVMLGLQMAYSYEFGIASIAAVIAMYALLIVKDADLKKYVPAISLTAVFSAASWFVCTLLLTREGFLRYIAETWYLSQRFAAGEQSFTFYWTANSLMVFALIALAAVIVGRGIAQIRRKSVHSGDRLLFCGLIYALVGLRSGLNRADFWHLDPVIIVLVVAFLLPSGKELLAYSKRSQTLANVAIVIIALTYVLGLVPTGSYFITGWLNGLRDTLAPQPASTQPALNTRAPSVESERSHPDPDVVRLGAYLAQPAQAERPVLFYGDTWALDVGVGVYKTDYLNDEWMNSEERGLQVQQYLREHTDTIVVIRRPVYMRLFGLLDPSQYPEFQLRYQASIVKSLASYLSTVHYHGVEVELPIKEGRWTRTVGNYVRANYSATGEFGNYTVLLRLP
jgi:hypothetical protein